MILKRFMAQSAGAAEYINCNAGALWNMEYPFIAIAPRFTLALSGST